MPSSVEYFLYMCMSMMCLFSAGIGFINYVMPLMIWISLVLGLILFWLPFILYTIYEKDYWEEDA